MAHSSSRSRYDAAIVQFSPLIWIAGLSSVAYQLASVGSLIFGKGKLRRPSPLLFLILAYCAIYVSSISLAAAQGADLTRALAALYNLSIWALGAVVLCVSGVRDTDAIRRASRRVLFFVFVVSVVAYVLFSAQGSVRFGSLIGYVFNVDSLPENLAANTNLHMTSSDWSTLGLGSRVSIMAPYPTALGMLALMLLALSFPKDWGRGSLLRYAPYVFFCSVVAFLCASRAAMGCVLIMVAAVAVFRLAQTARSKYFKVFIVVSLVFCAIAGCILLGGRLMSAWETINNTRADSSSLRFELYTLSVTSALEQHPIIGFGVKERNSTYAIPLGSHSTLFGSMYKTGLAGFILVSSLFAYIVAVGLKVGFSSASPYRSGLAAGCIAMIPLLVFEDIDAIPLVAYLFFLALTMMERRESQDAIPVRPIPE